MNFTDSRIQAYAEAHTSPEDPLLSRLAEETRSTMRLPQMLSGHLQGRMLTLISRMLQPARILEIGTFTGYSAVCLAQGLREGGVLHTIDNDPQSAPIAAKYFKEAKLDKAVVQHAGDALTVIPALDEKFDLAFIDADKTNYPAYYKLLKTRMRKGGVILADNVLWSGRVLDQDKDEETAAIDRFNKEVRSDLSVEHVLLPVRDGLMIVRLKD